ncbi:cell wall-active antibiotics response protein LiaF [Terribacillus sp. 179-K 1B1 HS]|uniref:cell wall-active antibiotics response protein LiaF n=1 Tax=Terribacillus sp. 179-K 1B1 HS TaxID=3142388 RepID=UPI00399F401C
MKRMWSNLFAIAIIVIGLVLVLSNIGVIEWNYSESWHYLYPVFIVLLGLKALIDFFRGDGGFWFGIFCLLFGGLLVLDRFEILTFEFSDVFKLWPLLIIFMGVSLLRFGKKGKKRKAAVNIEWNDSRQKEKYTKEYKKYQNYAVGEHRFDSEGWTVEPTQVKNAVGEYYVDFTKAFIPNEEIPFHLKGWAGEVRIILPDNLEFRLEALIKAGEINVFGETSEGINRRMYYETPGYADATRKLDIYIDYKAGQIRVDRI